MAVAIEMLSRCRALKDLPPVTRDALAEVAREVRFRPGERLIAMGEPVQRMLLLTSGLTKLVGVSANGVERILFVHRPGDVVGSTVLLDNLEHDYEATAMSPVTALVLSRRDLLRLGRRHPAIIVAVAQEVSRLLIAMTERVMSATSSEVPVRLSQLLLDFAERNGVAPSDYVPLEHPLTHEAMSQIVGASRPHTSSVLRDLEALGAVQRRSRQGLLVRPSRLHEIVERGELAVALGY